MTDSTEKTLSRLSTLQVTLNITFWQAVKMLFKRKKFEVKIHWSNRGDYIQVDSIEGDFK